MAKKNKVEDPGVREALRLFGLRFKRARQAKGFSVHDLAMITGVYVHQIYAIEKGKYNPTLITFLRLLAGMNVSLDNFCRLSNPAEAESRKKERAKKRTKHAAKNHSNLGQENGGEDYTSQSVTE